MRIKVVKTNVNLLEAETNRALKELEADNKVAIDIQTLRAHPTGDLILSIIKYVEDEERISLNDLKDIEEEYEERISLNDLKDIEEEYEEFHSVIKGSKSGKVW